MFSIIIAFELGVNTLRNGTIILYNTHLQLYLVYSLLQERDYKLFLILQHRYC